MSALVVDTSSWIDYFAGTSSDVATIEDALEESRAYLCPIVAAELVSGTLKPKERLALQDLLRDLPLCDASLDHWLRVGTLRADLRRKGVSVSTPDAHVAQCALDLGAELLTKDGIFALVAKHRPLSLR